ncbi:hypothetical protein PENSPDRAFT_686065 [Peniophora sp. CONT]|nr:hypothetical protein PENSPDRAFT_686065 [Peniophora sp. CONT]
MNMHGFCHLDAFDLTVEGWEIVGEPEIVTDEDCVLTSSKRPLELSPVPPSKRIRLGSDAYVDGGMLLGAEGGPRFAHRFAHTSHTRAPPTPGPSPSRSPRLPAISSAYEDPMDIDYDPAMLSDALVDQYGQPMHVFPMLSDENTISDELAHALLQAPRLGCIPLPSDGPNDYWDGYTLPKINTNTTPATPRKRDERSTLTPEDECPNPFKFNLPRLL